MRIAGFILGILGALAAMGLAMLWIDDYQANRELIESVRGAAPELLADLDRTMNAAYVLFGTAAAGLIGAILALMGRGKVAAPLMLIGALAPAIFDTRALVATSVLLFAALISFFAKRKSFSTPASGSAFATERA